MDKTAIRLVVVGDGNVGKTSMLHVYTGGDFVKDHIPTVYENKTIDIPTDDGKSIQLGLWDTAGQEDYDRIRTLCYPNTDVVLLCFAIDSPNSYKNVMKKWSHEIDTFIPDAKRILVGTKVDLRDNAETIAALRQKKQCPVSEAAGRSLCQKIGAVQYLECSAMTKDGLLTVFEEAIRAVTDTSHASNPSSMAMQASCLNLRYIWRAMICK